MIFLIFSNILILHSDTIRQMVNSLNTTKEMVGISVPVRANTLVRLLEVLTTSVAHSEDREELLEVAEAAELIGIQFGGYQLSKRSHRLKAASAKLTDSLAENISICKGDLYVK